MVRSYQLRGKKMTEQIKEQLNFVQVCDMLVDLRHELEFVDGSLTQNVDKKRADELLIQINKLEDQLNEGFSS